MILRFIPITFSSTIIYYHLLGSVSLWFFIGKAEGCKFMSLQSHVECYFLRFCVTAHIHSEVASLQSQSTSVDIREIRPFCCGRKRQMVTSMVSLSFTPTLFDAFRFSALKRSTETPIRNGICRRPLPTPTAGSHNIGL